MLRTNVFLFLLVALAGSLQARQPWQQEVNYLLEVTLVDSLRSIQGVAQIEYINHSPDTLNGLWFRFPPAALRGGSGVDRLDFFEDQGRFSRVDSSHWGELRVENPTVNHTPAILDQDYSTGLLHLPKPLAQGDTAKISLPFTTRFPTGSAASRIAYTRGQYKGAYWYPMICPYTPQYGWTVNRYYGTGEAYGEFGDFEIHYTVPATFIVASTGVLLNEADVLPAERFERLSFNNSADAIEPSSEDSGDQLTWIYRAERVPDVAFAMDPTFLIDRVDFGSFEAWTFVRPENKNGWTGVADLCGWTIQQLEEVYGPYPWPRVMATDSWSAMEYPMLTMMSGPLEGYEYVFIHEVVHNYTPMILHSNSVDNQALDEGFTTFVEQLLIKRYKESEINRVQTFSRGLFSRKMMVEDRIVRGTAPYLKAVLAGEDLPMIRGGDIAHDYTLLRVSSYYKTPVMLNALRYVVGEDAFFAGMKQYYLDNMLTHPDELDMIQAFEKGTRRPLGWFFKQFLYSAEDIDYAVEGSHFRNTRDGWSVTGRIVRKQGARLPLRLGVVCTDGDTLFGEVPFLETDIPLPGYQRWGSWDQLHEPLNRYSLAITLPQGKRPRKILVDPCNQLADRNPLNNSSSFPEIDFQFDNGFLPQGPVPVDKYQFTFSPALGWNERWGAFPGVRLKGGFFETVNRFDAELYTTPSQGFERMQGRFWGARPIKSLPDGIETTLYAGDMQGDSWLEAGVRAKWRTWGDRTILHQLAFQVGDWQRSSPWPESQRSEIPYLHVNYQATFPRGVNAGKNTYMATVGEEVKSFAALELSSEFKLASLRKWTLGGEGRVLWSTTNTPKRFKPGVGYASSYSVLGDPVVGGIMNNPSLGIDEPQILSRVPAGLVSIPDWPASQLAAWRFTLLRTWARSAAKTPLQRIPSHIKTGAFQTCGVYRSGHLNLQGLESLAVIELGVEAGLQDFYGLDLDARLVLVSKMLEPMDDVRLTSTREEFKKNFNFFVSYRVNRFFR